MVLRGRCTWARRYADWEIHASLRSIQWVLPNGLLGIVLPSAGWQPITPDRLRMNLSQPVGRQAYARWYQFPQSRGELNNMIEDGFQARSATEHLIMNPRDRFDLQQNLCMTTRY
jgi:hypothetical protein